MSNISKPQGEVQGKETSNESLEMRGSGGGSFRVPKSLKVSLPLHLPYLSLPSETPERKYFELVFLFPVHMKDNIVLIFLFTNALLYLFYQLCRNLKVLFYLVISSFVAFRNTCQVIF